MTYFLITFVVHSGIKHTDDAIVVEGDNHAILLDNMKELNRKKNINTTDYKVFDLEAIADNSGLVITER